MDARSNKDKEKIAELEETNESLNAEILKLKDLVSKDNITDDEVIIVDTRKSGNGQGQSSVSYKQKELKETRNIFVYE